MKLKRIFWVGLLVPALAGAQPAESALLALSGASAPEELSETEMELAESLGARPLRINTDPRSRLLASGLLTPFQVASLEDYQARLGDVRSWAELARVDGFTPEVVERIRPYVSLDSRAAPGASSRTREWSAEVLVQTAAGGKTGAKVRAGSARVAASLTWRDGLSGNLTLEGKARP
ncbi:MAG: general secretion pathway protein GspK, partial [Bacteroidales bacterium]|nr:general secretion pathway protein GspK [Bacteroidales bacterium]